MTDVEEVDIDSLLAQVNEPDETSQMPEVADYVAPKPKVSSPKAASPQKSSGFVSKSIHDVDLSKTCFDAIEQVLNDENSGVFDDPLYYKTAMTGEPSQTAHRLHDLLSKYLPCTDPKDKTVYRQQITSAFWEFIRTLAPKMADSNLPMPKRMLMRYAVVLPSLFTAEQKDFFSKVKFENNTGEPVLYMDEWFQEIARGRMTMSATDEGRPQRKSGDGSGDQQRLMTLRTKNTGKMQSTESLLNVKENERRMIETELRNRVEMLCEHTPCIGFEPHLMPYSEAQTSLFAEISERLRSLQKTNRELSNYLNEYQEAKAAFENIEVKLTEVPTQSQINNEDINTEMMTVRQMAKMTVGRKGNQFPVFTREFFHCMPRDTGIRENVINTLRWVESVDPGCFCRIHKNVAHRIVPYILLVPTYGDTGFCWEPFNRYNRVTSRGRIAIPMYPRDLKIAVLTAVADLRWQVAKEKASYYWMEEGLTGQYYQWIDSQKLKGDLKAFFIADYVLWMTKESEGVQKLDKEVRGIFWRHIPFSQETKDKLKTRSMAYQELYQRDINRAMSDGY